MRAEKKLLIIAFDISLAKNRRKVVSLLLKYGKRINKSVFECMLTEGQGKEIKAQLQRFSAQGDSIVILPICLNCYAKMEMIQAKKKDPVVVVKLLD